MSETIIESFPLKRCHRDGSKGWKWGDAGHCYTEKEKGSDEAAKEAAKKQGRAIESRQQAFFEMIEPSVILQSQV